MRTGLFAAWRGRLSHDGGDAVSGTGGDEMRSDAAQTPATARTPGAVAFWIAVALIGLGAGVGAAGFSKLLFAVQALAWPSPSGDLIDAGATAGLARHVGVLLAAGVLVSAVHYALSRLPVAGGVEITSAIWFHAGRLPALAATIGALLSAVTVAMGVSLGREGAPKQAGAVVANAVCDRFRLGDAQRRLLVACGAGAGMAAIYDVPLGGALFALEVMGGVTSLRLALPALAACGLATVVASAVVATGPLYRFDGTAGPSAFVWAVLAGPLIGVASAMFVRMIGHADRLRPRGAARFYAPPLVFGAFGALTYWFPQLLGNGQDLAQLAIGGALSPPSAALLAVLKTLAIFMCFASGGAGGLFTPTLTVGALIGMTLGAAWTALWPGEAMGVYAVLGAGAALAATTQGPISAMVLVMELVGRGDSLGAPMLIAVVTATLTARAIDDRSIYDARLTDAHLAMRRKGREAPL